MVGDTLVDTCNASSRYALLVGSDFSLMVWHSSTGTAARVIAFIPLANLVFDLMAVNAVASK